MCDHKSKFSKSLAVAEAIVDAFHSPAMCPPAMKEGSRRRKLWELPTETHCPVIGVSLPIATVRRIIEKGLGYSVDGDDYDFHVSAVSECRIRRPISEKIQRELDLRYAATIQRLSRYKSGSELAVLWEEAVSSGAVAEMLWATLTHPRCDDELRQKVCRDIHMFQHQAGAGARADLNRLAKLREENAALLVQLSQLREKHANDIQQRDHKISDLQTQLVQARGRMLARESEAGYLRAELMDIKNRIPDLPERLDLVQKLEEKNSALQQLRQSHAREMQDLEASAPAEKMQLPAREIHEPPAINYEVLRDKAVLCVGGRVAAVPVYRQLIECSGARFLHHDGGEEEATRQLDASLAAADLVICQTGCISHGAYWRVKEHCKRTGKQCVFVEKPSASSLARCLRNLEVKSDPIPPAEGQGMISAPGK